MSGVLILNRKKCVAMLLAGGQGSRLGVLTSKIAKPAVPYGGKYRIIDFPLSNCANSGIDTVGILTSTSPLSLTIMSARVSRGILTAQTEGYTFCRLIRDRRAEIGIRAPLTPFIRIWSLFPVMTLRMFLFFRETIFTKWIIPK